MSELLWRQATITAAGAAGARSLQKPDAPIGVSLSSESPVERWDWLTGKRYTEILSHAQGSVDLSRAASGLPLLLSHGEEQVGRAERITLGADRKLRGQLRFSQSTRGEEIKQDVLDGIRQEVSIGYTVPDDYEETKDKNGRTVRVYRNWTVMELSLVAVPADPKVGVGRAAPEHHEVIRMSENENEMRPAVSAEEQARIAELCVTNGCGERAGEFIRAGKTAAEVGLAILQARGGHQGRAVSISNPLDQSAKDQREFSLVLAIGAATTGDWKDAGYEREVSEGLAKLYGTSRRSAQSFFMPRGMRLAGWHQRVTGQLDTVTSTQGAEVVFEEPGSFIEHLRRGAFVLQAGSRYLAGLVGNVAFPKQTGAATASWAGQAPSSAVSASSLTLTQLDISPKELQVVSTISKRLTVQGFSGVIQGAEQMIRDDIIAVHAQAIDLAAINGSGTNNQPLGIIGTTGIGSVTLGTNGGVPTYDSLVDLETEIASDNALRGIVSFFSTPGIRGKLRKTQEFASTNGVPTWRGGLEGEVIGYRAYATNQVPSNLTKGTSTTVCHAIIAGNFQDLILGEWGVQEIVVDPYTLADRNLVKIVSFQMVDVGVRHAESFAAILDAKTS